MFQILIVDDDKNTRYYLNRLLSDAGYKPVCAASAQKALSLIKETPFDLIIVDIMMPEMDGFEFTKLLRDCRYELPILMLSAGQIPDSVKTGFLAGTDDYMTKPADEEELLLRIKALLRRSRIAYEHRLTIGKTILDYDGFTVSSGNDSITLAPKEFLLLYKLLSYPNKIFTKIQLLEDIWGPATESMECTVSVHINRLRNHFRNNPDFQIITIRGLGYKAQIKEEYV